MSRLRFGSCRHVCAAVVDSGRLSLLAMLMFAAATAADVVDIRVSKSPDDAEERSDGTIVRASSDLELVNDRGDNQTVSIRFRAVGIPQGAAISDAYIQFTVDETTSDATELTIAGQASNNATNKSLSEGGLAKIEGIAHDPPAQGRIIRSSPRRRSPFA